MARKTIRVGNASVSLGPELEKAIDRLVRDSYGDVVSTLESIGEQLASDANDEWYTNVTRRTGLSGKSTDYRIVLRRDSIAAVVYNDAEARKSARSNTSGQQFNLRYAYVVRRPGPFSKAFARVPDAEYAFAMSYFRRNGTFPEGYAETKYFTKSGREAITLRKVVKNEKARDGKNVWNEVVLKPSKAVIDTRLVALDKALTDAGKRFAKGV